MEQRTTSTESNTRLPDCIEGPEAFRKFDAAAGQILSVPHSEIMRREAEYKRQSALNPKRRGPKPKVKPSSVSPDAART